MKRLTPILFVDEIEPCLSFWIEGLGMEKTAEVPEGDRLGFVILQRASDQDPPGVIEVMLQTGNALERDLPAMAEEFMRGPATLYIEMESIDGLEDRLTGLGAEIIQPRRKTFYGADEFFVRAPCGTLVGLAAFEEE